MDGGRRARLMHRSPGTQVVQKLSYPPRRRLYKSSVQSPRRVCGAVRSLLLLARPRCDRADVQRGHSALPIVGNLGAAAVGVAGHAVSVLTADLPCTRHRWADTIGNGASVAGRRLNHRNRTGNSGQTGATPAGRRQRWVSVRRSRAEAFLKVGVDTPFSGRHVEIKIIRTVQGKNSFVPIPYIFFFKIISGFIRLVRTYRRKSSNGIPTSEANSSLSKSAPSWAYPNLLGGLLRERGVLSSTRIDSRKC